VFFFPTKCGSSISAKFLIYGAHAVCFLPVVGILDSSSYRDRKNLQSPIISNTGEDVEKWDLSTLLVEVQIGTTSLEKLAFSNKFDDRAVSQGRHSPWPQNRERQNSCVSKVMSLL
jgi:hypothetical protein